MRRHDDPVEVRKHDEIPDQFLWRGRLWQVREVVSHWVETGSWWRQDEGADRAVTDLLEEREVWRVTAARGRAAGFGVFDLSFDWSSGDWRLAGVED